MMQEALFGTCDRLSLFDCVQFVQIPNVRFVGRFSSMCNNKANKLNQAAVALAGGLYPTAGYARGTRDS
jgi:hypothetical protein